MNGTSGLPEATLRCWTHLGLRKAPGRTAGGCERYDEGPSVARVREIRHMQEAMRLTLREIADRLAS